MRRGMMRERAASPDLLYAGCPDCGTPVELTMAFLTNGGKLIAIGTCAMCADHVTVKYNFPIDRAEYVRLVNEGMLMVSYGR